MLARTRLVSEVLEAIEADARAIRDALERQQQSGGVAAPMQLTPTTCYSVKVGAAQLLEVLSLGDKVYPPPWLANQENWYRDPSQLFSALGSGEDLRITLEIACGGSPSCPALDAEMAKLSVEPWKSCFQMYAAGSLTPADWQKTQPAILGTPYFYSEAGDSPTRARVVLDVRNDTNLAQMVWLSDDSSLKGYFSGGKVGDYIDLKFVSKGTMPTAPYYYAAVAPKSA